jgi:hypothetical protein
MSHRTRSFPVDIKIFCDESCHLEHDTSNAMVFGALACNGDKVKEIDAEIKALREKHGYVRELKWTKLSRHDLDFYSELFDLLLRNQNLRFKAVIVPEKSLLDHDTFNHGSGNTFYYKIAYYALRDFMEEGKTFRLYLDYMDTLGRTKVAKLKDVLMSCKPKSLEAQTIRSHESQLIQLCDLLIGAICYANRKDIDRQSDLKNELVAMIARKVGHQLDVQTSKYSKKFNLFRIRLRGRPC